MPRLDGDWRIDGDIYGRILELRQEGLSVEGRAVRGNGTLSFLFKGAVSPGGEIDLEILYDRSESLANPDITPEIWNQAAKMFGDGEHVRTSMHATYSPRTNAITGSRKLPKITINKDGRADGLEESPRDERLVRDTMPFAVISPRSLDGVTIEPELRYAAALDFANQELGTTSDAQVLSVTNTGKSDLVIESVTSTLAAFEVGGDSCTHTHVAPASTCKIAVRFSPVRIGKPPGLDEGTAPEIVIKDNTALGTHFVSLTGSGTKKGIYATPGTVSREDNGDLHLSDTTAVCAKNLYGWAPMHFTRTIERLRGQVLTAHVTTEDFRANHNGIDYNWFVYPDSPYQHLLAEGNFTTGDAFERGRLEVEWESQTSPSPDGIPSWAWPQQGDRVDLWGHHIADCGHGGGGPVDFVEGGEVLGSGYRAEIHPPSVLVTYRNSALARLAGVSGRTGSSRNGWPATHVDVFASTYGGEALVSEGQASAYDDPVPALPFYIYAPPRPSADAVLPDQPEVIDHPTSNRGGLVIHKLPSGDGYSVELYWPAMSHKPGERPQLQSIASTIWVQWDRMPAALKFQVRSYTVDVYTIQVIEPLSGKYSFYGYVNGIGRALVSGTQTPLGMPYIEDITPTDSLCELQKPPSVQPPGCRWTLSDNKFTVDLVPGESLHIEIRGISPHLLAGIDFGSAYFAGTAEVWLGPDDSNVWADGHEMQVSSRSTTFDAGEETGKTDLLPGPAIQCRGGLIESTFPSASAHSHLAPIDDGGNCFKVWVRITMP